MENRTMDEEQQYLDLVSEIINKGYVEEGRNGTTRVVFGRTMRFSLADGIIPILTTKRVAYKTCFEELFWFIRGSTSNAELRAKNVTIWDGNSSREFLDSRGLVDRAEGDLGPVYGFQWRHFNAPYANCDADYAGQGVDQLARIIADLKNPETRSSRRHILSAWNPCQLDEMALPPCHMICQFNVRQGKYLSCALFQRSGDVGLGVPFNIASYSMLTHLLANHCGLIAEEFVHFIGNCHIYEDHLFALNSQLEREPMDFPKIRITNVRDSIEEYTMDDIEWISPYKSHGPLKMKMSA
jgi:thymidylate synthase